MIVMENGNELTANQMNPYPFNPDSHNITTTWQ